MQEMIRAEAGWPWLAAAARVPARSIQSRLRIRSAAPISSADAAGRKMPGGFGCSGCAVGKTAPFLRSESTSAPYRSASATRRSQSCSSRLSAAEQEQRAARLAEEVQRGPDRFRVRAVRARRPVPADVGDGRRRGQALLLQAHVEADVDRRGRRRPGDRVGLGERVQRRLDRGGLVVPLGVRPDQRALVGGGVDPVDPGPPPGRVDRAGGPDDQHRDAVAPGVVDGHGRVHQADVAVDRDGHRPPGHLGVAVRDRDRVLLVQADEHPRIAVAAVVHQAVVQPAVARAGDERDVAQVEAAEEFGQRVAAPLDRDIAVGAFGSFGFFSAHAPRIGERRAGGPASLAGASGCGAVRLTGRRRAPKAEGGRAAGTARAARRGRCAEGGVSVHRPRA